MIEQSEKKRHELRGGKIRALYGHSTPQSCWEKRPSPGNFIPWHRPWNHKAD